MYTVSIRYIDGVAYRTYQVLGQDPFCIHRSK